MLKNEIDDIDDYSSNGKETAMEMEEHCLQAEKILLLKRFTEIEGKLQQFLTGAITLNMTYAYTRKNKFEVMAKLVELAKECRILVIAINASAG